MYFDQNPVFESAAITTLYYNANAYQRLFGLS